jgi:hypothetical protein
MTVQSLHDPATGQCWWTRVPKSGIGGMDASTATRRRDIPQHRRYVLSHDQWYVFVGRYLAPANALEVCTQPAYIVLQLHHHRRLRKEKQETYPRGMRSRTSWGRTLTHSCTLRHRALSQMDICGMSRLCSRHIRRTCSRHLRLGEILRQLIDERSCCDINNAWRKSLRWLENPNYPRDGTRWPPSSSV